MTAYKPGLDHYQLVIANAGRLRGKRKAWLLQAHHGGQCVWHCKGICCCRNAPWSAAGVAAGCDCTAHSWADLLVLMTLPAMLSYPFQAVSMCSCIAELVTLNSPPSLLDRCWLYCLCLLASLLQQFTCRTKRQQCIVCIVLEEW